MPVHTYVQTPHRRLQNSAHMPLISPSPKWFFLCALYQDNTWPVFQKLASLSLSVTPNESPLVRCVQEKLTRETVSRPAHWVKSVWQVPKGYTSLTPRAANVPAPSLFQTFSSYLTSQRFLREKTNPPLVWKNNQGKIPTVLLESVLLISELACPQVELLGELSKLFAGKAVWTVSNTQKGLYKY